MGHRHHPGVPTPWVAGRSVGLRPYIIGDRAAIINLMGMIEGPGLAGVRLREGMIGGPSTAWAELIARFVDDLGMDSFIYWPVAGDVRAQHRLWAEEVVPAARTRLGR